MWLKPAMAPSTTFAKPPDSHGYRDFDTPRTSLVPLCGLSASGHRLWAQRILSTNHNSPFEWVPASFAPRQDYEDFRRSFGSGEVLIISWPGCTVDSPDLELLAKSLRRLDLFSSPDGEPYIEQVVTGQEASAD